MSEDKLDPKEQMRLALERKKNAAHRGNEAGHADGGDKASGGAHGPAAGKKQFTRRKAGG